MRRKEKEIEREREREEEIERGKKELSQKGEEGRILRGVVET